VAPRDRKVPASIVDFDVPALGPRWDFTFEKDLDPRPRGRDFGVAVEVSNYGSGPGLDLAALGIATVIKINPGVWIIWREDEADPGGCGAALHEGDRLGMSSPCGAISGGGVFPGLGINRRLGPLAVAILPTPGNPTWQNGQFVGNSVWRANSSGRLQISRHVAPRAHD
jgi:hypothetical protein